MRKVNPEAVHGNGLWNHFAGRKKYEIVCGDCSHTFREKVPFRKDTASVVCPCCGAQNVWSHSKFEQAYDKSRLPQEK